MDRCLTNLTDLEQSVVEARKAFDAKDWDRLSDIAETMELLSSSLWGAAVRELNKTKKGKAK